jgi:Fe-S cluster assembly protein SufD
MNDVLSFYQEQAKHLRSAHPELANLQAQALERFVKTGFPTRRDESWKYSAPDLFLKERFYVDVKGKHAKANDRLSSADKSAFEASFWGQKLSIENGEIGGLVDLTLPSGMFIGSFAQALEQKQGLLEPYLGRLGKNEHGFHALNTAMLQTNLLIYVPKDQHLVTPLTLAHWQNQENQAVFSRYVVILEKGASLTLIEDYAGLAACAYMTSSLTDLFLAEGAELTHIVVQRESRAAFHVSHAFGHLEASSKLNSHVMHLGGKWVRSDKSFYLQGKRATCLLNGLYGLANQQHLDQHTLVRHEVSDCESTQDYKGVVTGPARAVFNGAVVVEKDAQRTRAQQQNKNLLLSKDAEVDTKPQLEIFANDVVCSHGATVGQLSEEALFYFLSRGIAREEAIRFLVDAFTATNLAMIEDVDLRTWLADLLHAHLQGG